MKTLNVPLTLEPLDGLVMTEELATFEDPACPVASVNVGFPAPLSYVFQARDGKRYVVGLRPVIDAVIAALEADDEEEEKIS